MKTVFDLKIISIAVVIAIIVGAGAGYMVGNAPVSSLMEERDQLEAKCDSLYLAVQNLAADLDSIQELLVEIQRDVALLEQRYMEMLVIDKENQALKQQVIDLEAEIVSLQNSYEELQILYSVLEQEHNSLELSYEVVKRDYEKLRECIPSGVGMPYSELKNSPEGYSRNELISRCGEKYLIPAPINADIWEVNITIISELSWQPVHIKIYTVYEDYPPDWLGQPFAPYARGEGEVSISLTLNTSYAYVLKISDAYAKPFTGFIEERWYLLEPEVTATDIPGIVNGDFSEDNEGWYTQGKSSEIGEAKHLHQHYSGTYMTQEIVIQENQGIAFMLKSNGARLEVQIDGHVIFYDDFRDGTDWTRIIVPFGNTYLGPRDLYFIVLAGEDDGSYIALDDITMVKFTS